MPNLQLKSLNQISNSVVLVRTNYDLPDVNNTARIKDSLETINLLLKNGNKVVICTHWGRPKGYDHSLSTEWLDEILEGYLRESVLFVNQYDSFAEAAMEIRDTKSRIILLENTRFEPLEKAKIPTDREQLAQQYASIAQVFVDEAFAVSHRQEATNHDIKKFLPWCYGASFEQEIKHLDQLKNAAKKPFVAIMGGSKLETKLALLDKMLPKVDKLLIGGMLSFTFLQAVKELQEQKSKTENTMYKDAHQIPKGLLEYQVPEFFASKVETDFLSQAKDILIHNWEKVVLPCDFVYGEVNGEKMALDIGLDTVIKFQERMQSAATVFWNGPMGFYERKPFDQGTVKLGAYLVSMPNCFVVIGGGDVGSALPQAILEQFGWVSMGGGATLDYLSK
jgi:phosphoglycerate kinase